MLIEPNLGAVADKFFSLTEEQPYGGAALAIYQNGVPVLDIWGGEARPGLAWQKDTKSVVFSTSKGILSILVHQLIQDGFIDPDEKVSKYWPEFAANGKENVTVAMIMRHRSGLSAVRDDLTFEDLQSVIPVENALANQKPIWEPDTGYLYHAGTIGQLIGKIIFNVTGMRINELLQSKIARPLSVEAWYGIPSEVEKDVTFLKSDDAPINASPVFESPEYWNIRAMTYGNAFRGHVDDFEGGYNDPRTHALEHAGAGGISNARSVAKIYSSVVCETDGVRLLSDETIMKAISRPNPGPNIFGDPAPYPIHSLGFIVANPVHSPVLSPRTFGHDGLGGQQGFADLDHRIGFSYVTNWIPMVKDGMARHREITKVLAEVLR
ncbi:AmpC Beta-lactamase class C and other penicillin binding proteins [Candidatus Nanopelagicaceae bacterium]